MLGNTKGKMINQYVPDYVLYDLETTGTSSKYDEVIEISAVKVKNGVVTEEFSQLVNPGRPIPSAASAVNHITDDMVAFAPMFDSVLQQFLAFIGDDVLAGHNINRFDMKFLYRDCERYFGQTLTNDYIDTLKLARLCLPELSHHRLEDLAQYYGISTAGAHRALNDCRMNQQVFEKLAKELDGTTGRNIEIKAFLWTYEREGYINLNVKADPQWRDFWRSTYASVIPGWHQNKDHWNTIILDGTVPEQEIQRMIAESYDLVTDSPTRRIYEAVKKIPRGKVATYGQVAEMAGNKKMARAVGNALHKNPDPEKIPCYRVVNAKGELAGEFAFGGEGAQARLLQADGIAVVDGRVDLKIYGI